MTLTVRLRIALALGVMLVMLGLATALVPPDAILTPAHRMFFETMPRWAWGLIELGAGLLLVIASALPGWARRNRHSLGYPAIAVCLTWAAVAAYPASQGKPWNVVSTFAWVGLAAVLMLVVNETG